MFFGKNAAQEINAYRQLYLEKNAYLDSVFERVEPLDFYREIFPVGSFERRDHPEDAKGNGIGVVIRGQNDIDGGAAQINIDGTLDFFADSDNKADGERRLQKKRYQRFIVHDDLSEIRDLQQADFSVISPISYYGRRRIGKNARFLYALAFDIDGVDREKLENSIYIMFETDRIPHATFIVNSGTGLHLYYVFEEPIPMYPHNQVVLKELKYSLTMGLWNFATSNDKQRQMQSFLQGFRVVGSPSKLGRDFPVVAYRTPAERTSVDELMEYIPSNIEEKRRVLRVMQKGRLPLNDAKEKYPDWYERRIVRKETRPRWTVKRALYDWWKKQMPFVKVGHRYFGIMALAIYAVKCGISWDELQADAMPFLDIYDKKSTSENNRFTKRDIDSALKAFRENYVTFPKDDIERLTDIRMYGNRRNGRDRATHIKIMNFVRDEVNKNVDWRKGNGRKPQKKTILNWRQAHPDGQKIDCAKETGLSLPTVRKWWNDADNSSVGVGRPSQKKIILNWRQTHPNGIKSECILDTGLSWPTVRKWWNDFDGERDTENV